MAISRPPTRRVNVRMVAELARVSTTTVSRVLNGKAEAISAATAQRVIEAARALNYQPSSLAISLRKGTTRTIGLIIPDIADAYFHQLARGVEDAARAQGYAVIFCNTDRRPDVELFYLTTLREKQVDGIIFAGGGIDEDRHLENRDWAGANVVAVAPHRLPFPAIGVDNAAAIAAVVSHLAEQGCREIACIGGQPNWLIHQERRRGFLAGLKRAGLKARKRLLWTGDFRVESGFDLVERALAKELAFDGIVAFNDYSAFGAMQALRRHRKRIPEDVAVVGCDDIVVSTLVEPPLSSVAFPLHELGASAFELVLRMAQGQTGIQPVVFDSELKVRQSSLRRGGGRGR